MTADIEEQLKAQLPPEMISEDMTVLDILKMMPQEQKQVICIGDRKKDGSNFLIRSQSRLP